MTGGRVLIFLCLLCFWSYGQSAPGRPPAPKEQRSSNPRKTRDAITPPPVYSSPQSVPDKLTSGIVPPASAPAIKSGSSTVRIPATQQWVDTGVDVVPGTLVDVSASGEVILDGEIRIRPEGATGQPSPLAVLPLPAGRLGAVIVKVKYPNGFDSNILAVGRGLQFRVEEEEFGRLYIGINTDSTENNSGQFMATLRWQ